MHIRPTQSSTFSLVRSGLNLNFAKLALAQEHIATGKKILRPSDDVIGTAKSLRTRKQLSQLSNYMTAVDSSRPYLEASTAALQDVSGLLTEAKALITQGMNGTLNASDREIIGDQLEQLLNQLVDVSNSKFGDHYLFGGMQTDSAPFGFESVGSESRVMYRGDDNVHRVAIGSDTELGINLPGSEIFAAFEYAGASLSGSTGLALGTSANQGSGFTEIHVRHDATTGTPGAGVTLANGGADDTILQDHVLTIDGAAGTVTLGSGQALQIPQPGDANYTDFVVTNEDGAEVHLDFSAYAGGSSTATLTGEGAVSLGDGHYTPIDFSETNLQLVDDASGTVVHLDTTSVGRASDELVRFEGNVSVFDALQGAVHDLKNADSLSSADFMERMGDRLAELSRNQQNALNALGTLGARTERLNASGERLEGMDLNLQGVLSKIEDADLAEVALELSRTEQTLQLAQLTGSRLMQTSLLNFLR